MPSLFDTLYQFNYNSSYAKYVINYGGRGVPKAYLQLTTEALVEKIKTENFYYSLGEYFETKDFVGFNIGNQEKFNSLIYSKDSKHTFWGKLTDKETGLDIPFPEYSSANQLVTFQLPENILTYYENNKDKGLPTEFIEMCKGLKKFDNPVIMELEFTPF